MATEVKHAIRTTAAWNANQTAMEAIYGVGGYYTTLSAWEAAQQRNLVTADEIAIAECYNDWTGNGLNDELHIMGWTTDATRSIIVRAVDGHRHDGTPGTGFRMYVTERYTHSIDVSQGNVLVEGIAAGATTDAASGFVGTYRSWSVVFDGCISTAPGGSGEAGFLLEREIARNCIAINATASRGFGSASATWVGYEAFNCVAVNCSQGFGGGNAFDRNQGVQLRNCIAYNCITNNYSQANGKWIAASSNNAASNGATVATPGTSAYASNVTSADFVNAAGNDFHLASGSGLIGAGANLYSGFTKDIDGEDWPSSGAWDIGFDHYVSVATTPTLSSLSASNLTATGARLSVDLTF